MVWLIIIWIFLAGAMLWVNIDMFEELWGWRTVLATVILILFAPAFFIANLGDLLLDCIAGEEEEEDS